MSAISLDGNKLAALIEKNLAPRAAALRNKLGRAVKLAVVAGAGDAASSYLLSLVKAGKTVGIETEIHDASKIDPVELARTLARSPKVDAILIDHPNAAAAASLALPASKDAEGLTPASYGALFQIKTYRRLADDGLIAPCTALAVAELLRSTNVPLEGKRAVVVGRSAILGRPAAHLLSMLDLTVTLCHGKTKDLAEEVSRADVLVACLGKPGLIQGAWIKKDSVVIDAGINVVDGKLRGDVDPSAKDRAAYLTPVPGGVGPVTTAMLLANTLTLAERAR